MNTQTTEADARDTMRKELQCLLAWCKEHEIAAIPVPSFDADGKPQGMPPWKDITSYEDSALLWHKVEDLADLAGATILTGPSRIVMIDLDTHQGKNGSKVLADWLVAGKYFPDLDAVEAYIQSLPCEETVSGGLHVPFRLAVGEDWPEECKSVTGVLPGVDIRGPGGAWFTWPSIRFGKQYAWMTEDGLPPKEFPRIPDWGRALCILRGKKKKKAPAQARTSTTRAPKGAGKKTAKNLLRAALEQNGSEGTRNAGGLWLACQLRDSGVPQADAEELILAYQEGVDAGDHPYTRDEALATLRSAYNTPPRAPQRGHREPDKEIADLLSGPPPAPVTPDEIAAWLREHYPDCNCDVVAAAGVVASRLESVRERGGTDDSVGVRRMLGHELRALNLSENLCESLLKFFDSYVPQTTAVGITPEEIFQWLLEKFPDANDDDVKDIKVVADLVASGLQAVRGGEAPQAKRNNLKASLTDDMLRADLIKGAGGRLEVLALEYFDAHLPKPNDEDEETRRRRALREAGLNDHGNASAFTALHGSQFRYLASEGVWLEWAGHCWARRSSQPRELPAELALAAVKTIQARQAVLESIEDEAFREACRKFLNSSLNLGRQQNMIAMAQALLSWSRGQETEPDPDLLCVNNGVLDTKTLELRPGRQDDYITRGTRVSWNPEAVCPRFERFMEEVFPDPAIREFVMRALGYTVTGHTSEQVFFLCHGDGSNGKGRLFAILRYIMGEFARNTPFHTFEDRKNDNTFDLAELRGRRLVTASETQETGHLNESRVKALTGQDPITACHKFQRSFEFTPGFKIWLSMNRKPMIRGTDHGLWRRIIAIPFDTRFEGEQRDSSLDAALRAEAEGILVQLARGAQEWHRVGLSPPQRILEERGLYREASDDLGAFLEQEVIFPGQEMEDEEKIDPVRDYVPVTDLRTHYVLWCVNQGEKPLSSTTFSVRVQERGARRGRVGKGRERVFYGLRSRQADLFSPPRI